MSRSKSEGPSAADTAAPDHAAGMSRRTHFIWLLPIAALAGVAVTLLLARQTLSTSEHPEEATPPNLSARSRFEVKPFDFLEYIEAADKLSTEASKLGVATQAVENARLLAPSDPLVVRSAYRVALARGDTALALSHASRLFDISKRDRIVAFTGLADLIEAPAWEPFFAAKLTQKWAGIDPLIRFLCEQKAEPTRLLALSRAAQSNGLLGDSSQRCVENKLVQFGLIEAAYQLRVVNTIATGRIDFVANGEFELDPSGSAFDWRITAGGQYRAGFDAALRSGNDFGRPGAKLVVRFNGRPISGAIAQQHIVLPPGRYRLTTALAVAGLPPQSRPDWKIYCRERSKAVLESQTEADAPDGAWTRSTRLFSVPATCASQLLTLELTSKLSALEGVQGVAIIDSVRIERL
jgi:hypothetical protein